jgi:DUF1680 family protein
MSAMHGVTRTDASPAARLRSVPVGEVTMHPGFWSDRMAANRRGIAALGERLEAEGVVDNFRRLSGALDAERRGLWFTDSDLYKWIEGAAWSLATAPDDGLRARLEGVVDAVIGAQAPDGYLNTAFGDARYADVTTSHELYCAGHLFQAAVAHHRVTGEGRFLACAARLADHLCATFGPGLREEVDAHPGVEMGLVELARETADDRYLTLARWFLDRVDHAGLRELWGHAVRAEYYACGLADVVLETGDDALARDVARLWSSMVDTRSYVTGGVGGRWLGESVGRSYELPNASAYAETCAGIGAVLLAWRMLQADGGAEFADQLELALHNAALVGMALAGDEWSYVNPLADSGADEQDPWMHDVAGFNLLFLPARRRPFHPVTCCPPNVNRLVASMPGYLYGTSAEGLWVHLYAGSSVQAVGLGLTVATDYPWSGRVDITVDDVAAEARTGRSLFLRIPGWCAAPAVTVNDECLARPEPGAYLELHRRWAPGDRISLDLAMPPEALVAHPRVESARGSVAIQRGPLVYCAEAVDHPGVDVLEVGVATDAPLVAEWRADLLGGVTIVRARGTRRITRFPGLYAPASTPVDVEQVDLTLVPYYAWANRELGAMTVWLAANDRGEGSVC